MPTRLREPGWSAACELQKPRCSLPGDSDWPQRADDHVVVPLPQPVLVLRVVDDAHASSGCRAVPATACRTARSARTSGSVDQQLDGERLAGLGVDQLAGRGPRSRPRAAAASPRADCCAPRPGCRRPDWCNGVVKTSGGTLSRTVSRIASSAPSRQAGRRQLRALEIAVDALVLAEEDLLVHLLEIEREVEGAAHARILELVAPADVERERLHAAGGVDREFLQHHALVLAPPGSRRRSPSSWRCSRCASRSASALKASIATVASRKYSKRMLVEIVAADVDVDVLAPVVRRRARRRWCGRARTP